MTYKEGDVVLTEYHNGTNGTYYKIGTIRSYVPHSDDEDPLLVIELESGELEYGRHCLKTEWELFPLTGLLKDLYDKII